jgi:hypothetical protein
MKVVQGVIGAHLGCQSDLLAPVVEKDLLESTWWDFVSSIAFDVFPWCDRPSSLTLC